jgi:hypothetical protein
MKSYVYKYTFKHFFHSVLVAVTFLLILSCAKTPNVIGKWIEIGKTATLEFWKDGTFKAVDNQGMAVRGKYTFNRNGNVRFEIERQGASPEIINGTISVRGDELTVTSVDGKDVERYRKAK